ncbi:RHS repeat-associated core domain-containing protein [Ekhidna sp.]
MLSQKTKVLFASFIICLSFTNLFSQGFEDEDGNPIDPDDPIGVPIGGGGNCNLRAGSLSGTQTICYGGNPSTINGSSASGSSSYSYQWQIRSLGGSWSSISGATGRSYNPPVLTSTKEYRRRVKACNKTKYTGSIRITVRSSLSAGSIGNAQTVCYNGNPSTLSNAFSASGGNSIHSYQWQQRSLGGSWGNISGATGTTYNPPNLTSTREYRRRVVSCSQTKYSNTVRVTVRSALNAGSISNAQTVCYNGNPSTLSNASSASGGNSSYSYQWQHRSLGGSWSNLSGATSTTYNPPVLTSSKEYRRRVVSCGQTKYTNTVRVTVRSSLNAGSIGNAQTVCYNENPSTLSNASSPTGGNGSYAYQWQQRSPGGSWSNLSGATGSAYDPPNLTSSKEYRRRVVSCSQTKYSTSITVTVRSSLSPGSIGNAQTICYNGDPSALSNVSSPSGGNGSHSYQWQQRSPGGSWSNISGATSTTYNPSGHTSSKEYRRRVSSCNQTVYSNTVSISISIPNTPTPPSISPNICGPKTLTRANPPSGETWYWQTIEDGEDTSNSEHEYQVGTPGSYYLRSVSNGGCWGPSVEVSVTLDAVPDSPSILPISYSLDGALLQAGTAPANETWYWQTTESGTDETNPDSYIATSAGTYYIRSKNDNGCWSAASAITLSAHEPTNVSLESLSSESMLIRWSGAGNETGFSIYRATSLDGTFAEIHTADATDSEYIDNGLSVGTTYFYLVMSLVGTEKSIASNVLAETTPDEFTGDENQVHQALFNGNISAMRWKGANDDEEKLYTYGYDGLNRLKNAQYAGKVANTYQKDKGFFSVPNIDYDLNGNITSLTRQGINESMNKDIIDELSYTYGVGGSNQLKSVTDAKGVAGFKDGNTSDDDYRHDENGNMIQDLNKGITNIEYNYLNLPSKVIFDSENYITYIYDASGIKLQQKVFKNGTLSKTTDYSGQYIYETEGTEATRKLQLIQHEEGRIVPVFASGSKAISGYDYQYHLKDHLGNVRATFSTTPENYTMIETFETGEENGWQDLNRHTNQQANTTSYEDGTTGDEVQLLQSGQTGALVFIGLNKSDTINLSVNANYEVAPSDNNFAGTVYSSLFGSYNGSIGDGEAGSAVANEFNDALSGADMAGKGDANEAPRTFLNYIFFDKQMNYIKAGFKQISTAALGAGTHETISINDIIADQEGYILAYLSNENQEAVNVHFDDFTVYHGKTNVVSTQDYYPFGLAFNESVRTASEPQKYLYNGKELQEETGWLDYGARMYHSEIGRFFVQDRFSEKYMNLNPYQYAANNPISNIDINGDSIITVNIQDQTGFVHGQNRVYIDHTELENLTQILHFAAATETHIHINSSFRTNKRQQELNGEDSDAITPAPAGNSPHNAGVALDFNVYNDNDPSKGLMGQNANLTDSNPFIDALKNDSWSPNWRWGGDFSTPDRIHIDNRPDEVTFAAMRDANQQQMNGNVESAVNESYISRVENMNIGGTRRSQKKLSRIGLRSAWRGLKNAFK